MQYMINQNIRLLRYPLMVAVILQSLLIVTVSAAELNVTLEQQEEVSLTVYNQNLALIRDVRKVPLKKGLNQLAIREVSAQIRPETAIIKSLDNANALQLLEQNFDYDLLTPHKLLQKYVGQQVRVVKTHPTTGAETEQQATVLSANEGVVLKIGDRIETGIPGRIVYENVPANLRDRPTLSLLANSSVNTPQTLELSYLSSGLSWRADYVAKLAKDDKTLDLNGWVTLNNQSGASYHNANLQLVAGDLNRVRPQAAQFDNIRQKRRVLESASALQEESLFEYHLYNLGRQTDILQNQTKQVALLSASNIPIEKEFLLQGQQAYYYRQQGLIGDKLKVGVYVEFENAKAHHLGLPLPKGVVRVYKNDSSENIQFIGEDRIDHTPKDETIRLKLGDAFDVTAKKTQTDYKKEIAIGRYKNAASSSYEIEIHNAKDEAVSVRVLEPIPGDWKMLNSSIKHKKVNAHTAEWLVTVAAEQRVTLSYQALVRY